jgi:aminoglycoside phosphotransferase (APT) family kinase protein
VLTRPEVVDYLLQRGLMSMADVVDGGFVIDDVSRRNHNLVVRSRSRPGLFLKQRDPRQSAVTLHREADAYRLLGDGGSVFARHHLVGLLHVDSSRDLLVLEHLDGVEPLHAARLRGREMDEACARGLGRALGRLHDVRPADEALMVAPTWALSLRRPTPDVLTDLSSASLAVIGIVQQSRPIAEALAELARSQAPGCLIHGDMRLDNCLVTVPAARARPPRLAVVDWELAGVGDPAWDVATVLCEYLAIWLRSIPLADSLSLDDSLALAEHPLSEVRPAVAAFWDAYRTGRGLDRQCGFLIRTTRWLGARLVQTAIEIAQTSSHLTRTVVYMLQLAEHALEKPEHVAKRVLRLGDGP